MYTKEIYIQNRTGLHARPASDFVRLASSFRSKVELNRLDDEDKYNAKSIVMLLALGLEQGEHAILSAEGADEQEAVEALSKLLSELKD